MTGTENDQDYDQDSTETRDAQGTTAQRMPAFSSKRLGYELGRDAALRWVVVLGALGAAIALFVWDPGMVMMSLATGAIIVGVWAGLNLTSARVTRRMPEIAALMERDPSAAETALAQTIPLKPMLRWVRLALYHRLAILRHRQGGYAESAGICQAVLGYLLSPGAQSRAPLLLMLCEARLECNDLAGAYHALGELYYTRLSLTESLQRLALQTRYEVKIGRHHNAIHDSHRKVQVAELMPAAQCGALHALLAEAASHTHQPRLAQWLWNRTQLLCTPTQIDRIKHGGSILGLADESNPFV